MSPETTECEDPSDLESYVCEDAENGDNEEDGSRVSSDGNCSAHAESMKGSVVGVMPVLEDGLSSGDERPDEPDLLDSTDGVCVAKVSPRSKEKKKKDLRTKKASGH